MVGGSSPPGPTTVRARLATPPDARVAENGAHGRGSDPKSELLELTDYASVPPFRIALPHPLNKMTQGHGDPRSASPPDPLQITLAIQPLSIGLQPNDMEELLPRSRIDRVASESAKAKSLFDSAILPPAQPTKEHVYFYPASSLVRNLYLNRLLHSALLD